MFFFVFLGGADGALLGMAYERLIAIRYPFRVHPLMSVPVWALMVGALVLGFLLSLPLTALIFRPPALANNSEIYHFFRHMPVVAALGLRGHALTSACTLISFISLSIPLSVVSRLRLHRGDRHPDPARGKAPPGLLHVPSRPGAPRLSRSSSLFRLSAVLPQDACTSFICPRGPATSLSRAGWCQWSTPSSLPS